MMHDPINTSASLWCILRTSGQRTISLARSLAAAGIETWTPVHTQSRRRPRSKDRVEREMPIAPTFVFAKAVHVPALLEIRAQPVCPHPSFSIFRHAGRVPLIGDVDIAGMRAEEDRAKRKVLMKKRHVFPKGDRVRVPTGPFAGMTGVVEDGNGKEALVSFGGGFMVKIASWLLESDDVMEQRQPVMGIAA